jgi:hypothetical protein
MAETVVMVLRSGLNPDLVLAAEDAKVVLRWYDPTSKAQQWTVELVVPGSVKFVNLETGTGMAADRNSQGSGITVSGAGDTWQFVPNGGQGYGALRPDYNTSLNLNVPNSNYAVGTPIVLWGWGGGAANEIWMPQSVNDIQPYPTFPCCVVSSDAFHRGVVPDSGGYALTDWTLPPDLLSVYTLVKWAAGGYSFQNQVTHNYICYQGDNSPLLPSPVMRLEATWELVRRWDLRTVIRPPWRTSMNWNAMGSPNPKFGAVIGSCSWNGGQLSEVWQMYAQIDGRWGAFTPP